VTRDDTETEAAPVVEDSASREHPDSEETVIADEETTATEPESGASEADRLEEHLELSGRDGGKGRRRGMRARIGVIGVATALILSAALAAWLYFFQYRPDQQTDAAAAQVALDAATTGTVALLSYSPDTLEQDFAAAKTHLTGEFLDYYTQFTQTIVTPAAKQKEVKTSASVAQSALAEMHPESAVALIFVNQTTVSKENPDGAYAASSVKVGLTKIDGKWLISSFDPV
jgi:Mce-associated membrane protein